jgi:hypothetical protein
MTDLVSWKGKSKAKESFIDEATLNDSATSFDGKTLNDVESLLDDRTTLYDAETLQGSEDEESMVSELAINLRVRTGELTGT